MKPNPKRSLVTFLRKKLAITGQSEHNGRGVYEMEYEIPRHELLDRILKLVGEYHYTVESVDNTDPSYFAVRFSDEYFDKSYRTLCLKLHGHGDLSVMFTLAN